MHITGNISTVHDMKSCYVCIAGLIRVEIMLQVSTLVLLESCRLSVKNEKFLAKLSWIEEKKYVCCEKNKHILGYHVQFLQLYSAPNCRESKIQHLTRRVVGTLKYASGAGRWFYLDYQCSASSEGINLFIKHTYQRKTDVRAHARWVGVVMVWMYVT